jgi:hypothetical protein
MSVPDLLPEGYRCLRGLNMGGAASRGGNSAKAAARTEILGAWPLTVIARSMRVTRGTFKDERWGRDEVVDVTTAGVVVPRKRRSSG